MYIVNKPVNFALVFIPATNIECILLINNEMLSLALVGNCYVVSDLHGIILSLYFPSDFELLRVPLMTQMVNIVCRFCAPSFKFIIVIDINIIVIIIIITYCVSIFCVFPH